jgi:hypothetical protein
MTDAPDSTAPVANGETLDSAPSVEHRRRRLVLLGASAALPSVYTLNSGARTAGVSSAVCWGNNIFQRQWYQVPDVTEDRQWYPQPGNSHQPPPTPPSGDHSIARFIPATDGWLRKRVYFGRSAGQAAYCTMSDQNMCVDFADPTKAAQGSVWYVNGQRVTVGPGTTIDQVTQGVPAFGLVYVDQQGTIATLDPDPTQLHMLAPVTEACWHSIIGRRSSPLLG